MQSRRDQVHAHMFVMGRITSGMLRADPDAPESPQGRTNRGVVIGIVIAVLLCGGSFVWGLLSPGRSASWQSANSLVVDQETGASYLYVDGRLRPVQNYASARLIGGTKLTAHHVRTKSLDGTPHGQPVGIAGAPDALPSPDGLAHGAWAVCSGRRALGSPAPVTTLAIGVGEADGDGALTAGQGMLVTAPDAHVYLVWQGSRLRLDQKGGAVTALGYGSRTPTPVSAAFVDALPAGPDLAAPTVPGLGGAGPALDGHATRIGQVFKIGVLGSKPRYYQLRGNGLVEVTTTVAALILADPAVRARAYGGRTPDAIGLASDALTGRVAPDTTVAEALPETPPRLVDPQPDQNACVQIKPTAAGPRVSVALRDPATRGVPAQVATASACVPVDRITVPPGGGALVRVLPAVGGTTGGTTYLVTDTGTKYRVASASDLAALGYSTGQAVALPSPLLNMLPTGPDLSAAAAQAGVSSSTAPPCSAPGTAPSGGAGTAPTGGAGTAPTAARGTAATNRKAAANPGKAAKPGMGKGPTS
ncbi:type VII secretion protein EccB [Actinoallomurus spadix]|uniref:Type VII secretion protein EccB n=1 Tax=Actinoallomurus spadix TaxID=79912 RepID=A0ABN0W869_9ACTN|nr:type VII secretion protein EccB [Actinoallomurus spadix]MCO5988462.1 type VII secretion protein EccB [Actinoallomurus spadix]